MGGDKINRGMMQQQSHIGASCQCIKHPLTIRAAVFADGIMRRDAVPTSSP